MKWASSVTAKAHNATSAVDGRVSSNVVSQNTGKVPAFFIRMELQDRSGDDINPAFFEDNYLTLWPDERLVVGMEWLPTGSNSGASVRVSGVNIGKVKDVMLSY